VAHDVASAPQRSLTQAAQAGSAEGQNALALTLTLASWFVASVAASWLTRAVPSSNPTICRHPAEMSTSALRASHAVPRHRRCAHGREQLLRGDFGEATVGWVTAIGLKTAPARRALRSAALAEPHRARWSTPRA